MDITTTTTAADLDLDTDSAPDPDQPLLEYRDAITLAHSALIKAQREARAKAEAEFAVEVREGEDLGQWLVTSGIRQCLAKGFAQYGTECVTCLMTLHGHVGVRITVPFCNNKHGGKKAGLLTTLQKAGYPDRALDVQSFGSDFALYVHLVQPEPEPEPEAK